MCGKRRSVLWVAYGDVFATTLLMILNVETSVAVVDDVAIGKRRFV